MHQQRTKCLDNSTLSWAMKTGVNWGSDATLSFREFNAVNINTTWRNGALQPNAPNHFPEKEATGQVWGWDQVYGYKTEAFIRDKFVKKVSKIRKVGKKGQQNCPASSKMVNKISYQSRQNKSHKRKDFHTNKYLSIVILWRIALFAWGKSRIG